MSVMNSFERHWTLINSVIVILILTLIIVLVVPIDITLVGIVIDESDVQPQKALEPSSDDS